MFDITSGMVSSSTGYIATIMSDIMPYLVLIFGLFAGATIVSFIFGFIEDARLSKRLEMAEKNAGVIANSKKRFSDYDFDEVDDVEEDED